MKFKKYSTILVSVLFVAGMALSSCNNSRKYGKVKSSPTMGNVNDKNKHVWGK